MGWQVSKIKDDASDGVREAMFQSKLADLKQMKTQRDTQISMRMAMLRDRVHWLVAFYTVILGVNFARRRVLGRFEAMPLAYYPYIMTPFAFMYQADYAYGSKSERINFEALQIVKNEKHWFNEPLVLPKYLEGPYNRSREAQNRQLAELGALPEKDWAVFNQKYSNQQISQLSFPITRVLFGKDAVEEVVEQLHKAPENSKQPIADPFSSDSSKL
mmetsp:Transcript_5329/g.6817  ORF Transcript_5329/g.6817 Transcript_5329/m.6817 type:complete len:216 (-) Transcript_5329:46-693(-)